MQRQALTVAGGTVFASADDMGITRQAVQYGQRRIMRKLLRSVPFLGGLVAVATVTRAVRRKGLFGGTLDTALDVIPFVSGAKNVLEIARGRDFIADRPRPARQTSA